MLSRARELARGWRSWAPGALVGAALLFFVIENRSVHTPIDDAFIFYRYARNLAEGHGLVFNVGERVEGFTSLLWTLLVAAGVAAGGNAVAVGHWLGVASGALVLVLTYRYAAAGLSAGERVVAALATWLLALGLPFAVWATSGLETPLFAAAIMAALVAEGRGYSGRAVLASALAVLIRPEGLMLGGVVFAFLFLRSGLRRRKTFLLLGGYLLFVALLTGFRLAYFGAPLPNTFYAKVGGAMPNWGLLYFQMFLLQTLLPLVWPSAHAILDRHLTVGWCWAGCVLVWVFALGGDAFSFSRFFVPALPVLCAAAARGVIRAQSKQTAAARFAMLSLPVCGVWYALGTVAGFAALISAALASFFRRVGLVGRAALAVLALIFVGAAGFYADRYAKAVVQDQRPSNFRIVMQLCTARSRFTELRETRTNWKYFALASRYIADRLELRPPAKKLVATVSVGAFGFYSDAKVLDLVGLVDPTIARSGHPQSKEEVALPGHQRTNAAYVLSKNPDYILIPRPGTAFFPLPPVVEMWNEPELARRYQYDPEVDGYRRID